MDQHPVLVEWLDSSLPLIGWRFLDEAPALEPMRCRSVGYVVKRDDTAIMLAPNVADADSASEQANGFITIPLGCVERIVELRETPTSSSAHAASEQTLPHA